MGVLEELFVELHLMIRAHGIIAAPHMHSRNVYVLKKRVEFEPHGRASETWEDTWRLELPWCYHHWKSTTGWRKGKNVMPMVLTADSMKKVIRRASVFLIECQQQGLRLGDNIREQEEETKTGEKPAR